MFESCHMSSVKVSENGVLQTFVNVMAPPCKVRHRLTWQCSDTNVLPMYIASSLFTILIGSLINPDSCAAELGFLYS